MWTIDIYLSDKPKKYMLYSAYVSQRVELVGGGHASSPAFSINRAMAKVMVYHLFSTSTSTWPSYPFITDEA